MRSLSEMLIAIVLSLLVLSAIYAAKNAFLSNESPARVPSEGPAVSILPPHEVSASPEDFAPPARPAEPAIAPPAAPPPPASDSVGDVKALRL